MTAEENARMTDEPVPRSDAERVTICINTVDRPYCVQRLIKSIRAVYPSIAIIVADQNAPQPDMDAFYWEANVTVLHVPYDSGVGTGRNSAARMVETEFILYCDDDFIFSEETDVSPVIRIFEADPEVDIIGGLVRDIYDSLDSESWQARRFEMFLTHDRARGFVFAIPIELLESRRRDVAGVAYFPSDTVLNWKLCRRETVEQGALWDPRFTCNGEHEDFYLNVLENTDVKVAYCPALVVYHHNPDDFGYGLKRNRIDGFSQFHEKWGIREWFTASGAWFHMIVDQERFQRHVHPNALKPDPLLLSHLGVYDFDRVALGADRPKSWPVTESAPATLSPVDIRVVVAAFPGAAAVGQKFSAIVRIQNGSAATLGCIGSHKPALTYSVRRPDSQELLPVPPLSTALVQDIQRGLTFHYVNIEGHWPVVPGEAVEIRVELRHEDRLIAVSEPCRLAISDGDEKYAATRQDGISFSKDGLPQFLLAMYGLSDIEDWGRWSDANFGEAVEFHFAEPLPELFDLVMKCWAAGPNVGQPVLVRSGKCTGTFIGPASAETIRLRIRPLTPTNRIAIVPPCPVRPMDIIDSVDHRRLGVALVSLRIEAVTPDTAPAIPTNEEVAECGTTEPR